MANQIYKIDDLTFRFPKSQIESNEDDFELGPLNFNISKGKLTSILGRSGSGKTTLLSLIGLLRMQTGGQIHISPNSSAISAKSLWADSEDIEFFRAENIGFALQKGELLPFLNLYDNAALVPRFLKKPENEIKQKLTKSFNLLYEREASINQLDQIMNSFPKGVSQGQLQRGAIVRALANDPAIVLADEPTGNLDPTSGNQTMQIFRNLVDDSNGEKSIIVVTHDVHLAVQYADEIIILKNGKLHIQFVKDMASSLWIGGSHKDLDNDGLLILLTSKYLKD